MAICIHTHTHTWNKIVKLASMRQGSHTHEIGPSGLNVVQIIWSPPPFARVKMGLSKSFTKCFCPLIILPLKSIMVIRFSFNYFLTIFLNNLITICSLLFSYHFIMFSIPYKYHLQAQFSNAPKSEEHLCLLFSLWLLSLLFFFPVPIPYSYRKSLLYPGNLCTTQINP